VEIPTKIFTAIGGIVAIVALAIGLEGIGREIITFIRSRWLKK